MFARIDNDNNLELVALKDVLSNQLLNNASIAFTLVASGDVTGVQGQGWPSSMTLVNSDSGHWHGTIVNSCVLTNQGFYQCLITVTHAGKVGNWRLPVQAIIREE